MPIICPWALFESKFYNFISFSVNLTFGKDLSVLGYRKEGDLLPKKGFNIPSRHTGDNTGI